jgi:toxin FitB
MPAAADSSLATDSSLAVPLIVEAHEAHASAMAWRSGRRLVLCGQAWIETYAVLTRLPGGSRLDPADAARALSTNFGPPLAPHPGTWAEALDTLAAAGVAGGAAYDGWIALTALDAGVRLASADIRAEATYRRLGVDVELVGL